MFKNFISLFLVVSVGLAGVALAAYGPAPAPKVKQPSGWTANIGYGQTFGHKKSTLKRV